MIIALLSAALLATPPAPSLADNAWTEQNGDRVVAVAGDQVVTVSDIRRELAPFLRTLSGSDREKDTAIRQAATEVLRNLTDRAIVLSEFRGSGMTIPPAMVQAEIDDIVRRQHEGDRLRYFASLRATGITPAEHRRQLEDRIIFDYMLGQVRRSIGEASPARIQAFYDANKASFTRKEEVRFRQISVLRRASETPEETLRRAQDARASIMSGEGALIDRFIATAKVTSDDDYRAEGGDAGWRAMADLAGPVAEALSKVPDGGVSDLLTLETGGEKAHFILLRTEFRAAGVAPIEDMRQQIATKIREDLGNEAVKAWLERLREKHSPQSR
jgi:peptidyl-prolyl cis-trans isomerase SurA